MKMKVLVLLLLLSVCSSLALTWQTDTGSGRPYHYGEESFRHRTRSRQGRFWVLERFTHELLEDAVGNYRVAELEAAPRAFLQPSHYDADEVMFVKEGDGVVVLLRGGRRESFCVREGDVMVIPAGAVVYSANTHHSEWFRVVMLLSPISTSGRFEVFACTCTCTRHHLHMQRELMELSSFSSDRQEFFPIGGESPESFLGVFSDDVIQASFNLLLPSGRSSRPASRASGRPTPQATAGTTRSPATSARTSV
jgi:mannose-6-phosphate isomerase-like protein (cupin superfamily)